MCLLVGASCSWIYSFFFKQKTAYEMRISDCSSDVCSSDLAAGEPRVAGTPETVKKFIALGATLAVETGAGAGAAIADADYRAAGATVGERASAQIGRAACRERVWTTVSRSVAALAVKKKKDIEEDYIQDRMR